jgi:hypothetical protein
MLQVATKKIEGCCATVMSLRPTRLPAELEEKKTCSYFTLSFSRIVMVCGFVPY